MISSKIKVPRDSFRKEVDNPSKAIGNKINRPKRKKIKCFFEHDIRCADPYNDLHILRRAVATKFKQAPKKGNNQKVQNNLLMPNRNVQICCCHCSCKAENSVILHFEGHSNGISITQKKQDANQKQVRSSNMYASSSKSTRWPKIPSQLRSVMYLDYSNSSEKLRRTTRDLLLNTFPVHSKEQRDLLSVRETHQIAEAQQEKNAKLREAFGISEYFVDGTSFDPNRKTRDAVLTSTSLKAELLTKSQVEIENDSKYALVRTPSKEKYVEKINKIRNKNKRKQRSRSSPDRKRGKKKKSKKRKKER